MNLEFDIMEGFRLFNIDCGIFLKNLAKEQEKAGLPQASQTRRQASKMRGKMYWYFNPRRRLGNVVYDEDVNIENPLAKPGSPERKARIEELRKFYKEQEEKGTEISPFD